MTDAVVAGHICLDIIPALGAGVEFQPGRLVEAGPATLSTGGAVSNVGLALNRLGMDVGLVGKVGDDLFGDAIRSLLDRRSPGLGSAMTVAPGESSSYTVVISLAGQDRMFLHSHGCNDTFVSADVPDSSLTGTRLMHFGYPPLMARMFADEGAELEALLARAKRAGATTSLDLSLPDAASPSGRAPWGRILARVLPWVDVFLPSHDELGFMLGSGAPEELAKKALGLGAKVVGLKLGSEGFLLRARRDLSGFGRAQPGPEWEGAALTSGCFRVEVAGTTGSGDATIAGFLMGLLRGFSPAAAVEAAVAVGACCCERPDATSGIRTWDETRARIAAGWERRS